MKKFLFTLAALMMAGSLCAEEYLYIEDFEIAQNQLNKTITVPVKAHFEAAVNAAQCNLTLPEGLTLTRIQKGSSIAELTYVDEYGDEWEAENTIFTPAVATTNFAFATVDRGYYEVDGEWVPYGAVKFLPGEYEEMAKLTIRVDAEFKGGEIIVETMPACGNDERADVVPCEKNQDNFMTCVVTVEGVGPVEPQILTGNIEVSEPTEDGIVYVNYTGNEVVTITVNGEAYNGEEIQLVEGENTLVVVVEAEGYETLTETFVIEWTAPQPPEPEKTEAPVISYELTEDAVIVTAEGAGEVILYCEGQPVENPYTIARGEQDATFVFTATAQEADKEISDVTTLVVTVPAISGEEPPVDPHMEGYWLVVMDKDGNPVWYQMFIGDNGDYTTTIALDYVTYGGYNHDTGERPAIDYYFVIDGVRYGAPEAEVATVLGTALDNALVEGEGFYTLPVGYNYNMGVAISPDGEFFVYAAQAGFVGVDELNADKTVAGVRYFNLAGQEMQEANGMTIVVTTYTDGTTSAVKVMK